MHHFTIVLPTGHQHFTTDGRFIMGANLQTCAVNAEAARLAVFTLAGEADRNIIRAEQWARAGLNHCQRVEPSTPPTAHTAALRMQHHMMAVTGESNPNRAHDVLMAEWLAKHPNPTTKPAPQPRPFAPVPTIEDRSAEIVAKREAEARTVARVAACADEGAEKEHIVKVDATPQRPEWAQPLPKPTNIPDTHYAAQCRKCSGSGIYAMMVRNGQPWSTTGTTCYPCNGRGWVLRRKPSKRNKPAKTQPVPSGTVSAKSVMESPAWQAGRDEAIEQMINRRRESREQLASDIEQRKAAK